MVVSPDVGGVVRARALAKRLGTELAIVDKRRDRAGESEVMNIIGDVEGRSCILVDDIVDSGGTICNAAEALIRRAPRMSTPMPAMACLSGGAVARIQSSVLKSMVVTDSIAATNEVQKCTNIRRISIAPLIGEAMQAHQQRRERVEPVRLRSNCNSCFDAHVRRHQKNRAGPRWRDGSRSLGAARLPHQAADFAVIRPDGLYLHLPPERNEFLFEADPKTFVKFMWGKSAVLIVQPDGFRARS